MPARSSARPASRAPVPGRAVESPVERPGGEAAGGAWPITSQWQGQLRASVSPYIILTRQAVQLVFWFSL